MVDERGQPTAGAGTLIDESLRGLVDDRFRLDRRVLWNVAHSVRLCLRLCNVISSANYSHFNGKSVGAFEKEKKNHWVETGAYQWRHPVQLVLLQ